MVVAPMSLPWDGHLNFLLQYRLKLPYETDVRQPFLHHHGYCLRSSLSAFIDGIFQHLNSDAVPSYAFSFSSDFFY